MPREPRMKLEKPSERIKDIARGYVSDYPEAIMIFLDEQYEKEGSIVGVGYDCLSTHGPNGYCENCQKYEENTCCEKCKSECWRDNTAYYFPCECHKESPQAKEKESKCMKAHCKCMNIGNGCTNHHYNSPDCFGWLPKEPVSERNDDDAKKCPYRIPDCPIDYPDVSERNSLIDELVGEVDKLIGNLNFKDMVINVLKSKKK